MYTFTIATVELASARSTVVPAIELDKIMFVGAAMPVAVLSAPQSITTGNAEDVSSTTLMTGEQETSISVSASMPILVLGSTQVTSRAPVTSSLIGSAGTTVLDGGAMLNSGMYIPGNRVIATTQVNSAPKTKFLTAFDFGTSVTNAQVQSPKAEAFNQTSSYMLLKNRSTAELAQVVETGMSVTGINGIAIDVPIVPVTPSGTSGPSFFWG